MEDLSGTEINKFLRRNSVTQKIYMGCYPSNSLPLCKRFPCAMVANHDEKGEPGSHWVAIYAPDKKNVWYFDSLGDDPIPNIKEWLYKNFPLVTIMNDPIQGADSRNCGYYAIYFIYMTARKLTYSRIFTVLSEKADPDKYVKEYVHRNL